MLIAKFLRPTKVAIGYSIAATSTTVIAALFEGSLIGETTELYKGAPVTIHPLISNYSTLIDFALLNPFLLYFLIRGYRKSRHKNVRAAGVEPLPAYHMTMITILCLVLSLVFMQYYYQGFLEGSFFDAVIRPNASGEPMVTMTGWIVFFWTTLIIFTLLQFSFLHISYIIFILKLKTSELLYVPNHEDSAGGQSYLIKPVLYYFNAALVMLFIFFVFLIYDRGIQTIHESRRLQGFAVFLLVAGPSLIFPIRHLRRLMKARREEYVKVIRKKVHKIYEELLDSNESDLSDLSTDLSYINYLDRYNYVLRQFPTWPIPMLTLTIPILSLLIALVQILRDLFNLI